MSTNLSLIKEQTKKVILQENNIDNPEEQIDIEMNEVLGNQLDNDFPDAFISRLKLLKLFLAIKPVRNSYMTRRAVFDPASFHEINLFTPNIMWFDPQTIIVNLDSLHLIGTIAPAFKSLFTKTKMHENVEADWRTLASLQARQDKEKEVEKAKENIDNELNDLIANPISLKSQIASLQRILAQTKHIPNSEAIQISLNTQIKQLQKEYAKHIPVKPKDQSKLSDVYEPEKKANKHVEKVSLPLSSLKAITQAYTQSPQAGNDLDDPTIQQAISSLAAEVDRVNPNRTEMDTEILKKNLASYYQIKKDVSKLYYRKPDHYEQTTPNAYDDYTVDTLFNTPETSENAEELHQTKLKTLFHLSFDGITISAKDYFIIQDKKNKYIFQIQLADEWFEKHIENPQPYYKV